MKAISNPEWHHVSLANIDFDMRDEKRKLVCDINQILKMVFAIYTNVRIIFRLKS